MQRRDLLAGLAFSPLSGLASAGSAAPTIAKSAAEKPMASLSGATGWLNSAPPGAVALRGNVVLVQFWTYSCINWLRTLPYSRAWSDRYKDRGLIVIGVHTPEFGFEKSVDDVRRAAREMRMSYPIAIDTDYAIWQAFDNHYWPALYVADGQGQLRHHHFGEGDYANTEVVIQQLLSETAGAPVGPNGTRVEPVGIEAQADWANLKSEETYVGYDRAERFASPGGLIRDRRNRYRLPARIHGGQWALEGDWTVGAQPTHLDVEGGRIRHRFHARDMHLVMGATSPRSPVRYRVLIDGAAPGADHGLDVDEQGLGTASEPRLYQLIRQRGAIQDREATVEFIDPGVDTYSFTFG